MSRPHFRVYAIDMIGEAGLSAPSRPPLDSGAYTQWLDEVLDSLSLDRVSIVESRSAVGSASTTQCAAQTACRAPRGYMPRRNRTTEARDWGRAEKAKTSPNCP